MYFRNSTHHDNNFRKLQKVKSSSSKCSDESTGNCFCRSDSRNNTTSCSNSDENGSGTGRSRAKSIDSTKSSDRSSDSDSCSSNNFSCNSSSSGISSCTICDFNEHERDRSKRSTKANKEKNEAVETFAEKATIIVSVGL